MHSVDPVYSNTSAHRYYMKSTRSSSAKFGPCEVCGEHATETFIQSEERLFKYGWTRYQCHQLFGHAECLESQRK